MQINERCVNFFIILLYYVVRLYKFTSINIMSGIYAFLLFNELT